MNIWQRFCFYINQTINIFSALYNINKIKKNLRINASSENNKIYINNLKRNINNIGMFAIKLVQWTLDRLNIINDSESTINIIKSFEEYYENCQKHSLEYTKELYFKDFNTELVDDLIIKKDAIASGSIGQVYEGHFKYNPTRKIALKVIHPNLEYQTFIPKLFLNIFCFFTKNISCLNKYHIPLNFESFFNNLKKQIDLNEEVKNMERTRELYKDNNLIVIPKVYKSSKNIILMSYEEGEFYKNLELTNYQKYKLLTILKLYIRSSCIINNFMHADLHNGNWKIRKHPKIKNMFQVILLDFGLCTEIEKGFYFKYDQCTDNDDWEGLYDLFLDTQSVLEWPENIDRTKHRKETAELWEKLYKNNNGSAQIILKSVIKSLINSKIIIENKRFELFFTLVLTYKHFEKYIENQNLYKEKKNFSFKNIYLNHITFSKTYDCFNKYSSFLENYVKENKSNYELFEDAEKNIKELNCVNAKIDSDSELDTDSDEN